MPNDPYWLPAEVVVEINKDQVFVTGENHAYLAPEKLEGAIMRPQNLYYYDGEIDIVNLSCSLSLAIGHAHAFEQGNKRTGTMSAFIFLHQNGYTADIPNTDEYAKHYVKALQDPEYFFTFCDLTAQYVRPHDQT